MIKVKDGYAKLIGTTYAGSANRVLLSNGGDHVIGNADGNIPLSNGTVNTNLNANLLEGYGASRFFRYEGAWDQSDTTKHVDNAHGMNFVYSSHGAPLGWGTLATFEGHRTSNYYNLQLYGAGSNRLYYRNYSPDNGQKPWRHILDDDNYPDYTVTKTGGGASGTWGINITGNAATATKLQTARTLTIGNSAKTFDGSANVSWPLHDILYNTTNINSSTSWDIYTPGVYYVASTSAFTGTNNPEAANGGTAPYRYGQLIVSRANNGGVAQFYISHNDSSTSSSYTHTGIKFRTGWNNSYVSSWRTLLDTHNYSYVLDSRYYTETEVNNKLSGYLPLSGGTMTGNIKVYTDGDGRGLKFGTSVLNSLSNQLLWQSAEAIRFGSSSWDWNAWAGLKYNHSNKTIYLGLADGTIFNANSGQSGGKLYLPGISDAYVGNGTYKILHAGNYNSYSPTLTGGGASGTWNIDINGNAHKLDGFHRYQIDASPLSNFALIYDSTPALMSGVTFTSNSIVTAPDNNAPFGKVWYCTGYKYWYTEEMMYFTPGETICIESWIMRPSGATGTNGYYYVGIQFRDKQGNFINSNTGCVYFTQHDGWTCPTDGVWYRRYGEYTIPKSHTAYNGSDGGAFFTGNVRVLINHDKGTIPTYFGGFRIYRKNIPISVSNATNATNTTNLYVHQHTVNNIEYPLVWSNEANTGSKQSNQLHKSYAHLTYNPSAQRITVANITSGGVLTLNGVSGVYLKTNNVDSASVVLSSGYFKPFDAANNSLSLGTTSARWSNVYSYSGNFASDVLVSGVLKIGGNATRNYLAFYGTTGDNPGSFNHTYIGENLWGSGESSELVLYKGNDFATSVTTVASSGPDRIRHIAAGHLFQVYKSALAGTFEAICTSTVPVNMLAIHQNTIQTYAPLVTIGAQYNGNYGIDMQNSDIVGINALYTADNAEGGNEGLQFARSNGYYDSVWASEGTLYFSPNGNLNKNGSYPNNYTILHTGNFAYTWNASTTVNAWSRIMNMTCNSNIILTISFSQNSQASSHTYFISTNYGTATVTQTMYGGYKYNYNTQIRITKSGECSFHVEVNNPYGYNSATSVTFYCKAILLSGNVSTISTYTAGGDTVVSSLTSSYETAMNFVAERSRYTDYLKYHDTRNDTINPNTYQGGLRLHFQANGTNNLNEGNNFYGLLHIKHYGSKDDHTGGYPHQIAFTTANNLWHRIGTSATSWGSWVKILDSNNYQSVLNNTYLPLAGGTMTGTLTMYTTGTGSYNHGIRINRVKTSDWALILIGKSGTSTEGTGTSTAGDGAWLIGTPASSNSLIFNLNNASESVGLCLKGHGNTDMKWNNNTVWHAGNDGSGSGLDSDLLDGYHESSFLRYRDLGSNGGATLWSQIGIRSYHNALPEGLSGIYNYGGVVSFPGNGSRLDIFTNHVGSSESGGQGGLWWRSGWNDDKRTWRRIIDSGNIASQSVNYANSAGYAARLQGGSVATWGTLTSANGYTNVCTWDTGGTTGACSLAGKGGQMSLQLDGFFYQNEGKYLVLDTNNYPTYLDSRYYTETEADSRFVNVTGDAMTGPLTFANGTWNVVGDDAAIGDYNAAGMLGLKSINNNIPGIGFHNSSNTLLGRLQANSSDLLWNDNKIWHAGNDGSGSGLDADLLDGKHLSDLNVDYIYIIDCTSLTDANFYPIVFASNTDPLHCRIRSSSRSAGHAWNQNTLEFIYCGAGWSDTPHALNIINYGCYSTSELTIGCIGTGNENGAVCIWVRGGSTYYISSNRIGTLKTSNYTYGNEIFTVGTNYYGGSNTKVTVRFTPQSTISSGNYVSSNFKVGGNCYAAHFYENSDIKLKTNIETIVSSSNIPQLKSFDWKSDGSHSYGLIAQELEEMGYSELVEDSGDHKTVNYSAALSLIVGKLQVKIKELEKEIEQLKSK